MLLERTFPMFYVDSFVFLGVKNASSPSSLHNSFHLGHGPQARSPLSLEVGFLEVAKGMFVKYVMKCMFLKE